MPKNTKKSSSPKKIILDCQGISHMFSSTTAIACELQNNGIPVSIRNNGEGAFARVPYCENLSKYYIYIFIDTGCSSYKILFKIWQRTMLKIFKHDGCSAIKLTDYLILILQSAVDIHFKGLIKLSRDFAETKYTVYIMRLNSESSNTMCYVQLVKHLFLILYQKKETCKLIPISMAALIYLIGICKRRAETPLPDVESSRLCS